MGRVPAVSVQLDTTVVPVPEHSVAQANTVLRVRPHAQIALLDTSVQVTQRQFQHHAAQDITR